MWGSDYPHPEGTYTIRRIKAIYPIDPVTLANTYHGFPLEKVLKIVGETPWMLTRALTYEPYIRLPSGSAPRHGKWLRHPTRRRFHTSPKPGAHAFRTHGPWD